MQTFKPGTVQANHVPALASIQDQLFAAPIQVPTLFFHGAKDGCTGAELAEGMESMFTGGLRKVLVPDASHFVHQEKPDKVNCVLVEFLKG